MKKELERAGKCAEKSRIIKGVNKKINIANIQTNFFTNKLN